MAKINSKNKGSSFERETAQLLCKVYNTPKGFSRSAGSGNRFGGKNSVNLNVHNRQSSKAMLGDIQTPDSVDLLVECKSYAELPFHLILQGSCKVLDDWLQQLLTDRETFHKVFKESLPILLVFKINRKGSYFVVEKSAIKKACRKHLRVEYSYKEVTYCIYPQDKFLENIIKDFKRKTVVR